MLRVLAVAALLALAPIAAAKGPDDEGSLVIGQGERLVVVAPHPDDETLGAGGLIQRVLARSGSVRVVTLTAGDGFVEALGRAPDGEPAGPSDFLRYGEIRIAELQRAVTTLGRGRVRLDVLGFPDGGLDGLLHDHWSRSLPERSRTTGWTRPPYPEATDRGLSYLGVDLRSELARIFAEAKPSLVAFPDPSDRHPDHAATGVFTLLALSEPSAAGGSTRRPRLIAYLVHWPSWPEELPPGEVGVRAPPLVLPGDLPSKDLPVRHLTLADAEMRRKATALSRHETQQRAMGHFLSLFERRTEPFRLLSDDAPERANVARRDAARAGGRLH